MKKCCLISSSYRGGSGHFAKKSGIRLSISLSVPVYSGTPRIVSHSLTLLLWCHVALKLSECALETLVLFVTIASAANRTDVFNFCLGRLHPLLFYKFLCVRIEFVYSRREEISHSTTLQKLSQMRCLNYRKRKDPWI